MASVPTGGGGFPSTSDFTRNVLRSRAEKQRQAQEQRRELEKLKGKVKNRKKLSFKDGDRGITLPDIGQNTLPIDDYVLEKPGYQAQQALFDAEQRLLAFLEQQEALILAREEDQIIRILAEWL